MENNDSFAPEEHQVLVRSASESAEPLTVSALQIGTSPRSPKTHSKHGSSKGSPSKGSPRKHSPRQHSPRDGRPKKGGCVRKGNWGELVDPDDTEQSENPAGDLEEYKMKATIIVEEYFATDDVVSAANELRELGMDRHDKEKEMAAALLSALYADVIDPQQVYRGFIKLVESADDLIVDIPDAVDVLALFTARAVVDDMLPPAFLKKQMAALPKESKGIEVLKRAEKGYLAAPLHAEIIERRWGGSKKKTVEDVKVRINDLLIEYIVSGDKKEAFRCIKYLKVPFFHHEIVKRAVRMGMERCQAEGKLLDLLKEASGEGLINASQITKGFSRMIDMVDDLSLDIPNARRILQSLISTAASEGWLCASSLKSLSLTPEKRFLEDVDTKVFKMKAQSIIQEYFSSGDIAEVSSCLESDNRSSPNELNAIFVKRLITLAMDKKKTEKKKWLLFCYHLCFSRQMMLLMDL